MNENGTLTREEWDLWHQWMQAHHALARAIDRRLQDVVGISKAEFSVLMTLHRALGRDMRVGELAESLDWEKSRVAHQLTRMEKRGMVARTQSGTSSRRTGLALTPKGQQLAESALLAHAANVRQYFLDPLSAEQAAAILSWCEQMIDRAERPEYQR